MKNRKTIFIMITAILLCFACFGLIILIYTYLTPLKMNGSSMTPTIEDGEYIITNSMLKPKVGSIVVYKDKGGQKMIKRIIAEEYDIVEIREGKVYVNSEAISEPYLQKENTTFGGTFIQNDKEYNVPENSYFILGDNRSNSRDSREFGFVKAENIISVFWFSF